MKDRQRSGQMENEVWKEGERRIMNTDERQMTELPASHKTLETL